MLTVNVKFIPKELTPGLSDGEYSIGEGSCARDILTHCENVCGTSIPEKNLKLLCLLFNGKPVTPESAITENGILHVCRVITGG